MLFDISIFSVFNHPMPGAYDTLPLSYCTTNYFSGMSTCTKDYCMYSHCWYSNSPFPLYGYYRLNEFLHENQCLQYKMDSIFQFSPNVVNIKKKEKKRDIIIYGVPCYIPTRHFTVQDKLLNHHSLFFLVFCHTGTCRI